MCSHALAMRHPHVACVITAGPVYSTHERERFGKRKKKQEKRNIFFLNIIIAVTEQQVWGEREDQRRVQRWPLAVKTGPTDEVKDKVSQSSLVLLPLLLSSAIAYFQPDLGFVHLVLWSRLQTSCPNFTCHSRLHLLEPQMRFPSTSSCPFSLLLSAFSIYYRPHEVIC